IARPDGSQLRDGIRPRRDRMKLWGFLGKPLAPGPPAGHDRKIAIECREAFAKKPGRSRRRLEEAVEPLRVSLDGCPQAVPRRRTRARARATRGAPRKWRGPNVYGRRARLCGWQGCVCGFFGGGLVRRGRSSNVAACIGPGGRRARPRSATAREARATAAA